MDGIINIQVTSIIAAQPDRKNTIPWFGKVVKIIKEEFEVLQLHKSYNNAKYFFLNEKTNVVHKDTIIYNRIKLKPVFVDGLLWWLLTPIPFIQSLNNIDIPNLLSFIAKISISSTKKSIDIIHLVFNCKDDFEEFLNKYN